MKAYRIILVILILAVAGCGAWYICREMAGTDASSEGTLVEHMMEPESKMPC